MSVLATHTPGGDSSLSWEGGREGGRESKSMVWILSAHSS